jgi:hypothetical protein
MTTKALLIFTSKIRGDFLQAKKLDLQYLDECSKEGVLNVLSDEIFLLNKFYLNIQHHSNYDIYDFVQDSLRDLQSKFDLKILVTLRNQTDLMFSQLIQKFKYLFQEYKIKSFDHFLDKFFIEIREQYDYSKLELTLADYISSDKVKWFFFEDFTHKGESSKSLLMGLLNCTQEEVWNSLESNYRERKTNSKEKKGVNVKVHKSTFSFLFKYISPKSIINRISNRLFYSCNMSFLKPNKVQRENKCIL